MVAQKLLGKNDKIKVKLQIRSVYFPKQKYKVSLKGCSTDTF
jgi:hypothetical protein